MVLEDDQILEIIKSPRNTNIAKWQEDYTKLNTLVNGGDVASLLEKIDNYENLNQKKLREKVAKSTKDKVSNLLKPLHKIFNAQGGSITVESISKTEKKKFEEYISKLPEGVSMHKWMEIWWKEAFVSDPNGIVLIEKDEEGNPYPTYKNITKIHDYALTWEDFEYIILDCGKKKISKDKEVQVYRVYDDEKDALYYVDDEVLKAYGNIEGEDGQEGFNEDHVFFHNHGFVPAIVCGGIVDKETSGMLSFVNKIDESLMEFLRADSVFTIYKFLHLFPKFWSYAMKCTTCNGTGQVPNPKHSDNPQTENKTKVCPTCNGKRLKTKTDVSDGIFLPIPKEGSPTLGGNVAGYIDTPTEAWSQMKEDLKDQLKEMEFSLWGAYLVERDIDQTKERTATETLVNVQPINETLWNVSRIAEAKETRLLEFIAKLLDYKKAEVDRKYGKRFTTESADALWKKYITAKEKQAPVTTLDYHYEQYLMSEFQNDLKMLEYRKKLFALEPLPHYSLSDISTIGTEGQKQKKLLFSQWISAINKQDFEKPLESLQKEFDTYFEQNKPETPANVNQE
tara:strand:+ start:2496 stop:4193 length:1698 start_codon:yes stop_codon:yes gene_type:complete